MAISVYEQMRDILDDVENVTHETTDAVAKKTATRAASRLRAISPGPVKYKKGWRSKKIAEGDFVVYNAAVPGFTHLLENGHITRNKYGGFGRAKPIKHIQPVEEEKTQEFIDEIIKELNAQL